jgi:hypothetical protein
VPLVSRASLDKCERHAHEAGVARYLRFVMVCVAFAAVAPSAASTEQVEIAGRPVATAVDVAPATRSPHAFVARAPQAPRIVLPIAIASVAYIARRYIWKQSLLV